MCCFIMQLFMPHSFYFREIENMNLNQTNSIDELRILLAQCNDEASHHILWVDTNGAVFISPLPDELTPVGFEESKPRMRIRYETYPCGCQYVGESAADDRNYVQELHAKLLRDWREYSDINTVMFIDY